MIKIYSLLLLVLLWSNPSFSQNDVGTQPPSSIAATQSTPSSTTGTPATNEPLCEKVAIAIVPRARVPYPPEARQQNIRGNVVLRVHVSTSGDVMEADVISGDPILAESAARAAKQWRYEALGNGSIPVACQTNLEVHFTGSGFGGAPLRIRLSEAYAESFLTHQVAARKVGIKGTVVLVALISEQGTVEKLQAFSGPPELVSAAMDAVQHWTFKPYVLNGQAVEVERRVLEPSTR